MNKVSENPCSECAGRVEQRVISQEFEREGVRITISGLRVLVCSQCGEIYFEPGGSQALVEAANSLFALARSNRQHRGLVAGAVA